MQCCTFKDVKYGEQLKSKKLFADASIYFVLNQVMGFSGIITMPLIIAKLSLSEYGVFKLAQTNAEILIYIIGLGLPYAPLRFIAGEKNKGIIGKIYFTSLAVVTGVFIIVSMIGTLFQEALVPLIFGVSGYSELLYLVIAFAFLNSVYILLFNEYRLESKNTTYTILDFFRNVLFTFGAILILILIPSIYSIYILYCVVLILFITIVAVRILKKYPVRVSFDTLTRSMIRYGLQIVLLNLSSLVINSFNRYFLSNQVNAEAVGIFSANAILPAFILSASQALFFIYDPIFNKLWNEQKFDDLKYLIKKVSNTQLFFVVPMTFGVTAISSDFFMLIADKKIAESSQITVPFLAFSYAVNLYISYRGMIFMYLRRPILQLVSSGITALLSALLNYFCIRAYGLLGAGIASVTSVIIWYLITHVISNKYFKFSFDYFFLAKTVGSSIIMMFIVVALVHADWVSLLLSIVAGGISYGIAWFFIGKIGFDQRKFWQYEMV